MTSIVRIDQRDPSVDSEGAKHLDDMVRFSRRARGRAPTQRRNEVAEAESIVSCMRSITEMAKIGKFTCAFKSISITSKKHDAAIEEKKQATATADEDWQDDSAAENNNDGGANSEPMLYEFTYDLKDMHDRCYSALQIRQRCETAVHEAEAALHSRSAKNKRASFVTVASVDAIYRSDDMCYSVFVYLDPPSVASELTALNEPPTTAAVEKKKRKHEEAVVAAESARRQSRSAFAAVAAPASVVVPPPPASVVAPKPSLAECTAFYSNKPATWSLFGVDLQQTFDRFRQSKT